MLGHSDESDLSLAEAVYTLSFKSDELKDERKGVIEERLGLQVSDEQDRQVFAEQLECMGFDKKRLALLSREPSLHEMSLFAGYAIGFYAEDVSRAADIPRPLAGTPDLADTFNRARACADRDIEAIRKAVSAVTGVDPPNGDRGR